MKTMKFYVMMLMAAVMTFGLTACGDDNNDGGSGAAPDYIGIWVTMDAQDRFGYVELSANSWKSVEYKVRDTGEVRKNIVSGGLSVNGNQVHLTGNSEFSDAIYAVSGNTMTLQIQQNGRVVETVRVQRISSADAAAKVAAWEAMYIAWQNSQNNR